MVGSRIPIWTRSIASIYLLHAKIKRAKISKVNYLVLLHLGQAYFFTEVCVCVCVFLGLFCHNFTENDPQDLKMV
jgi:hypothetical protein